MTGSASRKPRTKHSLPGSPALWAGGFTFMRTGRPVPCPRLPEPGLPAGAGRFGAGFPSLPAAFGEAGRR
jgi:hypothetical protein